MVSLDLTLGVVVNASPPDVETNDGNSPSSVRAYLPKCWASHFVLCVMWYGAKVPNTVLCLLSSPWCLSFDALMSFGCVFFGTPTWGGGEKLSTPQVRRRLQNRRPRVLRRKRDCTPALFFAYSRWPSTSSLGISGGGRIALRPSSSQCRHVPRRKRDRPSSSQCRCVLRREGDRLPTSHNDQDPLLFGKHVVVVAKVASNGGVPLNIPRLTWFDTVWMILEQNRDKRGALGCRFLLWFGKREEVPWCFLFVTMNIVGGEVHHHACL